MKKSSLLLLTLTGFLILSCNQPGEKLSAATPHENSQTTPIAQNETGSYMVGDKVPNKLVCMINNEYMGGKPQIPVQIEEITYYGCCDNCKTTLNEKPESRMATDPETGKSVDKSIAYIVLLDPNGKVGYFESENTYNQFKNK